MAEYYVSGTRRVVIVGTDPVGSSGNAWNNEAVGAGSDSASLDKAGKTTVSAFGSTSAATNVGLWVSFNDSDYFQAATQVVSGAGDFHITLNTAAPYVRLSSSAAVTITGTIVAQ